MGTTPRASPEPQLRTQMSAVSFRSAVATGLVAKPAARDVKARAGLKVYARMTKDRVSLKKDSKWRSDIDIYPEWGEFPMSERTSPLTSLTYDEYKNNVSAEIILSLCDAGRHRRVGTGEPRRDALVHGGRGV